MVTVVKGFWKNSINQKNEICPTATLMRGDGDVTDWREISLSSSIPSNLCFQQNLLSFLKRTKQNNDLQILFGIILRKGTNLFTIAGWTKPRGEKDYFFK